MKSKEKIYIKYIGVKRMKIKKLILGIAIILMFPMLLKGQEQGQENQAPQSQEGQFSAGGPKSIDIAGQGLYIEVLEDFEDAEDWKAKSTSPIYPSKTLKLIQRGEIRSTSDDNSSPPLEESYSLSQSPDNPNHILGVKGYFQDQGFDRVEVSPPQEYRIRGKARQFSIWVLGRNFRHTLYIKLRDYRGKIHKLRLGRLNFFGWRKLTAIVPGWLPQSIRYSLLGRNLHFVSLYVVSDYHEPRGDFYFYLDGLKTLIDRRNQEYPGSEIRDNW